MQEVVIKTNNANKYQEVVVTQLFLWKIFRYSYCLLTLPFDWYRSRIQTFISTSTWGARPCSTWWTSSSRALASLFSQEASHPFPPPFHFGHTIKDSKLYNTCRWYDTFGLLDFQPNCTAPKTRNKYSEKWHCAASFPISAFMYLWDIYIFP